MGKGLVCLDPSSGENAIPDSEDISRLASYRCSAYTFLASFRSFLPLALDAFSILWRKRVGVRFDFGSANVRFDDNGMLLQL